MPHRPDSRPVPAPRPSAVAHLAGWGLAAVATSLLGAAIAAPALDDTPLAVGRTLAGSVGGEQKVRYTIDLPADTFVLGAVEQISVDTVVTIYNPDGEVVSTFDTGSRGPEQFSLTTESAGAYVFEVSGFEGAAGDFEMLLRRAEPLAPTPEGRVEQMIAPFEGDQVPGGVVAVVRAGTIVYSHPFGMANLSYHIPFALDTRTNIGSTSKQFTAFGVALLASQGKLSLDDDVRAHIPELPDLGHVVTLRHLLSHVSGYREFLNAVFMSGRRIDRGDWIDRGEIIALVQRQAALQNDPGAEWNYNNTGFALLATVVERVGGKPFPEWMRENVFEPLGMHDTLVRSTPLQIVENASQGYTPAPGYHFEVSPDLGGAMGAGGIYTTPADLATWMHNYNTAALGGAGVIHELTTPYILTNGRPTNYGKGLFIDEQGGLRRWQHGGADTAHRSAFLYFPDLDAGVVVLTNSPSPVIGMADRIAQEFFAAEMGATHTTNADGTPAGNAAAGDSEETQTALCTPEQFDGYVGQYEMDERPGFILTFTREGEEFYAQATNQPRLRLLATGVTTFRVDGPPISLTFHPGEDGTAGSLTLHQNGDHPATRLAEKPWQPDEAALGAYVGRYYSPELDATYEVAVKEGKLVLHHRRLDEITLLPGRDDRFSGAMPIADLQFERDGDGRVTGFRASNGRTRGVLFERFGEARTP